MLLHNKGLLASIQSLKPYEPPAGDAILFKAESNYALPAGDSLNFSG